MIKDDNDAEYQANLYKLCVCECEHCTRVSPHPVHNCFYKCKKRLVMDEKTMKKLGLNAECHCQCSDCITSKNSHSNAYSAWALAERLLRLLQDESLHEVITFVN